MFLPTFCSYLLDTQNFTKISIVQLVYRCLATKRSPVQIFYLNVKKKKKNFILIGHVGMFVSRLGIVWFRHLKAEPRQGSRKHTFCHGFWVFILFYIILILIFFFKESRKFFGQLLNTTSRDHCQLTSSANLQLPPPVTAIDH